jgi:peptide chain release factor 2
LCLESIRLRGGFDLAGKAEELAALDERASQPGFWNDSREAKRVLRAADGLRDELEAWNGLVSRADDLAELAELADGAGDADLDEGVEAEHAAINADYERMRTSLLFSGQYDDSDAFISISAGAGGTEATDWAEMLLRMYLRWSERRGFSTEIVDRLEGEETGIKSATVSVQGRRAYGWLRAEAGVHRLVRISPYDSQSRRHTTFVQVEILPEVVEAAEVEEIPDDELKIDTYRAQGAGGQHVNKTDSAVRLTHLPTGIVVSCQNERSQHKNRSQAMKVLKARLFALKTREQQERLDQLGGEKRDIAFGSQIRSYVLQPYQMIKDHRTKVEVGDVSRVLDGDLDGFIKTYLMQKASGTLGAPAPEGED